MFFIAVLVLHIGYCTLLQVRQGSLHVILSSLVEAGVKHVETCDVRNCFCYCCMLPHAASVIAASIISLLMLFCKLSCQLLSSSGLTADIISLPELVILYQVFFTVKMDIHVLCEMWIGNQSEF